MSHYSDLAIHGGRPVRSGKWPGWPISSARTVDNLQSVLDSGRWSISGPYRGTPSFEQQFARGYASYTGARHCVPASSGTSSLTMALEGCEVGARDEVIVPAVSWVASASAVLGINAVPVLTDVDPRTGCLDPAALEDAITPRCRAITVVHLGSAVADLHGLLRVAQRHGVPLIEDCAQAHGAHYDGQHVGTFGRAGTFSMQHSKLLTSGEGGAVITDDDELARRLEHLRADGRTLSGEPPPIDQMELSETAEVMGSNYCLSEFHAAVLLAQLEKLDAENAARRRSAQYLDDLLRQLGCEPQATADATTSRAYYCYVVALPDEVLLHTSVQRFAQALSAELSLSCKPMYASLNDSRLYRPETRRRFALDAEFIEAVRPQRFELPAATEFARRSIALPHRFLLAETSDMLDVQRAMEKVLAHARRL